MRYSIRSGIERAKSRIRGSRAAAVLGVVSLGAAAAIPFAAHAAATTVVVTPGNMQGWAFFDDNGHGGSGSLVNGPATPPLGSGSAQLELTAMNQGYALGNGGFSGTKLADMTSLSYNTYVQQGNNTEAPALQLNIDTDLTDTHSGWQGRLVYEPYYTHTVTDGVWQTWNTQDNAKAGNVGNWWFSDAGAAATSGCTQAKPCTWSEVLTVYPNAGINTTYPGVVFKAGSNWAVPFTGNVDAFTIGTASDTTTYNFESSLQPTSKDDCMNNGWKNYGVFKNQGDCVSFVVTKGRNMPTYRQVTGDLTLASPTQMLSFSAIDKGVSLSDIGTATYTNPSAALTYSAPLTCVNITGNTAYFAYVIPSGNAYAGTWVVWKVTDGSPDTAGFIAAADQSSANTLCESGSATVTNYAITAGDVVIQ